MHELGTEENAARVAKARLFCLRTRREIHLLPPDFDMPQTPDNNPGSDRSKNRMAETVVVLTIKHKGKLPADLLEKLTKRAYDCAAMDGIQPEVTAKEWFALAVRESA